MEKIKTILVSQPKPLSIEKSPYFLMKTKYNIDVEFLPFFSVERLSLRDFAQQKVEILEHTTIIFTSRTSIDHFFKICEESRINIPEDMRYICKSELVALYLQKYIVYRKRKISFSDGSFNNFMALIVKYKKEKMLLVATEPSDPEIQNTMTCLDINFTKAICSKAVHTDLSSLDLRRFDMLVFFSQSDIISLRAQHECSSLPLIATFGDTTTRASIEAGLTVNLVAPTPQAPSMAKSIEMFLEEYYKKGVPAMADYVPNNQAEEFVREHTPRNRKKVAVAK